MHKQVILVTSWLLGLPPVEAALFLLLENTLIFVGVLLLGRLLARRLDGRRLTPPAPPLARAELAYAVSTVVINSAVTIAGLELWRRGLVRFRLDVGARALLDVIVLLLAMDLAMYFLHRVAHGRLFFALAHCQHHRYAHPRALTLFVLHPLEAVAFGALWLGLISIYEASWLGMSIYLALNVAFGAAAHLGAEPLPDRWVRTPLLRHVATSTFHAQHHLWENVNYGFYTLVWDRLFGTLSPSYESSFGRLQSRRSDTNQR